ncbi:hypothetical protein GBF35_34395 [Nonomuraea phyllanthi]|uniref:hypothetical protein n=1 Tax=Nonomuraea phyllanthi TaxID=2219224 RepID=UPI001292E741|nr:hypothetical protein [Nonomuraea phyllanthi]QFY11015.1 hypothetical protein GBF35_34395 [Nonomuraea phyllanthi]
MRARILTVVVAAALVAAPGVAHAGSTADRLAGATADRLASPSTDRRAAPHSGHDAIRYASIKKCTVKGEERPCGDWRLVMHSGERGVLPDAQGVALDTKGRSVRYAPAPVAVSGNGLRVAYFTKKGRLAVRTLGGGVTLFAANALPRVRQDGVALLLSDDGGRLAATTDGGTRVFDTATGARLGTVPADLSVLGFSFDGHEILTSVDAGESVVDLAVYADTGERILRGTPPQVVVANGPQALSADGRTVASAVIGAKPQLVVYDLQTDQVTARRRIKLPAGELHMIDWTGDTQVTLHLTRHRSGGDTMTIVQIDTETGAVRVRDRYTMLKDTFVFAACGG